MRFAKSTIIIILLVIYGLLFGDNYPDSLYVKTIFTDIENNFNIELSSDGKSFGLAESTLQGYLVFTPDSSDSSFNRGLPSWNGVVTDDDTGFHIQMRFPYNNSWSPWLTVGYWKDYIWHNYGATDYQDGYVDVDYVKLDNYQNKWQFRVNMMRQSTTDQTPIINKLSFFVSDSRTDSAINISDIEDDNPPQIYIDTDFLYQYAIDTGIGGDICSPTAVAMALKSLDIAIDPLIFARNNFDSYWNLFGLWPRVVQNASEYGVTGAVTRYRTWSAAYKVLNNGGRIVMSVGPPLYSGHIMMLAGFTEDGRVIVHDSGKSSGYKKIYDKNALSHSWFDKGGISYTFYPTDIKLSVNDADNNLQFDETFILQQNFPNPFNVSTQIPIYLKNSGNVVISIYDISGRKIDTIYDEFTYAGNHIINWNAANLASGTYYIQLISDEIRRIKKAVLIK